MATKAKDISHGKENHGKKKSSSTSIPNSPDIASPTQSTDKPVPNYLRHTISSAKDTSSKLSTGKKPVIEDASPRSTSRRKSLDRPPSQSQLQRTLSSNSRDKTPKTSSPSPKVTSSSRPGSSSADKTTNSSPKTVSSDKTTNSSPKTVSSDKIISSSMKPVVEKTSKVTPKVVKSTHHHQPVIAKTKTFKRTTSNVSSSSSKKLDATKGDTSPTITTTTTTTTTTDVLEISGVEVEQEDKGILEPVVVDGADILKIEEDEEIPFELPPDHDQAVILQNINHIQPEHSSENDQTPTEITEATMQIEEEQEEVVVKMSSPQTKETQEKTIDHIQIEEQHDENEEQQQVSPNVEDKKDIEDAPSESLPEIVEVDEVVPEENVEATREGVEGEDEVITEKPVIVKGEVKSPGSDNEETKAYKMKFRQAKELEVEQVEDGGSQKLKFKEREKLEDGGEEEMKDEAGNVILKKQEVNKGKKESQAYNDVIEETASKLVGSRKSKVKALVGAFETVISLEGTEGQ